MLSKIKDEKIKKKVGMNQNNPLETILLVEDRTLRLKFIKHVLKQQLCYIARVRRREKLSLNEGS